MITTPPPWLLQFEPSPSLPNRARVIKKQGVVCCSTNMLKYPDLNGIFGLLLSEAITLFGKLRACPFVPLEYFTERGN